MEYADVKHKERLETLLDACKENLPKVNTDLLRKSFQLSYEAHKNDFRASGEPYFYHPYDVALLVAREIPLDDISVVAALLHDVVEDTEFSLEFIEKEFGKQVADIVDGVTKISGVFKGHEITQAENYRKLLLSMVKDVRVILVKFADRLHNMRTLEFVNAEKQRRIARETLEIYAPFANRFGLGRVKWELEDLSFKYLNKEAYNEIARKIKDKRREREAYINKFIKPISERLSEHGLEFNIGGRPKHLYSIYRKMIKQNTSFEQIYDLLAIRIILESDDANECYYVLGVINQLYKPIPDRFKDYISIPKKNNYQSIHNTVIGPEGRLVEIQIRNRKMHEIAERGVAAHWKYKENLFTNDKDLEEWVNWIRDIFENASKDEATKEILSSFELNLYQDEIYVFTPNGDLKRMPIDSTPVDFAYQIHSNVGDHCIGAKVNGKIVPLNTTLHSGDQVEIITSKNQNPNKSWLQFVKTHKARNSIRKFINKEEEKIVEHGKEIWERKLKKLKLNFGPDDIAKLSRKLKFDNFQQFYKAIALDQVDLDNILNPPEEKEEHTQNEFEFDTFANQVRTSAGEILVEGEHKGIVHTYAKCCNPIPGDPIIGYISVGEGIKIHRKNCKNLINMAKKSENKLVPVQWPRANGSEFVVGINIRGEDAPGILKDISNSITTYVNTNIKGINISTSESMFNGTITVYVRDLEHLNRIVERLKKIKGIYSVQRFDAEGN
ncbi:MAG: bifunctional (p)ppGpp synthetase/guanosine-3',5'-bis(diphosphate) 3'-pyrophosphohydrolase [Melioribacteraceae bacterium]|nr:bifunctional (p)ppGpp synthetase/guanosine-3',5'-bis(diphosphate) 3'-pyrophosphohydrolase [Melioribacteraceae bacterium]MCF8355267.1 bifunctional (p)ppGpp synthetase/guanosine-3',5'-bis(diphosphate) 3'-pyrophosphohydrolase [Melioribacteraceae bacterium]MCF8394166.1 bifunctional (p)ppGpp synthetase/guanosine-3',5'-bis(diphosphate) 3'-pyrophosphohydrolase [Melioribacteraceae bacterium]MCF8418849.1 bifunctional (p)ppGpp synthetase/guanosine-3',5'-bis(diphosphate) 3'-pyrophosphohydrolase [Meliori